MGILGRILTRLEITLTADNTRPGLGKTVTFTGALTLSDRPVPNHEVILLVDGAEAARTKTRANGSFSSTLRFLTFGVFQVVAEARTRAGTVGSDPVEIDSRGTVTPFWEPSIQETGGSAVLTVLIFDAERQPVGNTPFKVTVTNLATRHGDSFTPTTDGSGRWTATYVLEVAGRILTVAELQGVRGITSVLVWSEEEPTEPPTEPPPPTKF